MSRRVAGETTLVAGARRGQTDSREIAQVRGGFEVRETLLCAGKEPWPGRTLLGEKSGLAIPPRQTGPAVPCGGRPSLSGETGGGGAAPPELLAVTATVKVSN